ncbi:MAG: acyl carrier protein [Muribaculaceae bacterium]|nr:acyl carrier protein [Muribaculaceae bacterium]
MNLEESVLDIMRSVFELDEVSTNASQKNCERWDSLHHLMLASELEDVFDIELEPEEIAEMTDFTRVVDMVKSKM